MSKPPRIDRKTLKNPDEFVQKGRATLDFLFAKRSRFMPVLIAAVVAVVAIYSYDWWSSSKTEKAWQNFHLAIKAPETERWDKLKTLYNDSKTGRPAFFAAVALADHYFDEAKKELVKDPNANSTNAVTSAEWYGKALESADLLPAEQLLLRVNRAGALEMQKKWDEATSEYQKAADIGAEGKGLALIGLARVHESKGDMTKAVEVYEKITKEMGTTEYGKFAKNNLRRLKSPLFEAPKS